MHLVNVMFCDFPFSHCYQKGSSICEGFPSKITIVADSGASSSQTSEQQQKKRQQGGGRKRSTKLEDDKLVKRLKLGESVARNERELKMLEDVNLGTLYVHFN